MARKSTSQNTECLEVSTFCGRGSINTKSYVSRKHLLYPAAFLQVVIYSPRLAYCKEFRLEFWITNHFAVPTVFLHYQSWCCDWCFESNRNLKYYLPRQEQWSFLHLNGWWESPWVLAMVVLFIYLVLSFQPHLDLYLPWNPWNWFLVLTRDGDAKNTCAPEPSPEIDAETAIRDDFASRKARAYKKAPGPRQKFVHFGPVTEIDQQTWKRLSIGKAGPRDNVEVLSHSSQSRTSSGSPPTTATFDLKEEQMLSPQSDYRYFSPSGAKRSAWESNAAFKVGRG